MHVKDTKLILVTLLDLNHDGLGEAEWTGEWAPLNFNRWVFRSDFSYGTENLFNLAKY